MTRFPVVAALIAVSGSSIGLGQGTPSVTFEVASIRQLPTLREENRPGTSPAPATLKVTPARVDMTNVLLRSLVPMAFGVPGDRVEWPQWMRDSNVRDQPRFNIQATIPAGVERARVPDMLRALLIHRFGLVARVESRPQRAYALVVGTGGHRMREVKAVNDLAREFPSGARGRVNSDDTITPLSRESLLRDNDVRRIELDRLTTRTITSRSLYLVTYREDLATRDIDATRITMTELANVLGHPDGIPIVDRTGLAGVYEFKLTIPDTFKPRNRLLTDRNGNPAVDRDPKSGLSIFKAVEMLGLRLEERMVPFEFLVVQEIRRVPTEN